MLRHARDHRAFSITQVSLLPPPWLEFTTSDPLTSAVRVSPPGSTHVDRPLTLYGRRSTCRGAGPSSVHVGQVDRVTTGWAMKLRGLCLIFSRNSARCASVEACPISMP